MVIDHGDTATSSFDREIKEAVRLARYVDPHDSHATNNGTEADRRKSHGLAYRLEDAPTEWRAGLVAGLFLLQHTASSRLRLGMGQFFLLDAPGRQLLISFTFQECLY